MKLKLTALKKITSGLQWFSLVAIMSFFVFSCQPKWDIQNPYANVDWNNHQRFEANFHTHTTRSDGRMNPQTVVDKYHDLGYEILAVTDHNEVTYPWTGFSELEASSGAYERLEEGRLEEDQIVYENRDPKELGMLAIQGNELSRHHHMGSYFSDHNGTETEEESLDATAAKNGLVMFNHPGRYTARDPDHYSVDWYVNLLKKYDHLIGVEIYNQGDRYPNDRELYDAILSRTMPDRQVWAYSNDDMHHSSTLGRNWNVFLLPELNETWVRKGMQEGVSYYVYSPSGHNGAKLPEIAAITVNNRKGLIDINVTGQDSVRWISGGEVVHRGNQFSLKENPEIEKYVRAEIFGPGEVIMGTQPFGIR
ncbi:hypothetical protein SAMN05444274_104107 [Mariniphaga anaerophila]|uniref:Polymerase/histidinol phosphatase N-terminal domain-containing protein n=1 Tax=Mariniphaga anaerophila TaxID=1484053 RepID=A0A1M4ZXM1_9BACT|nr:hypothetical protein [Mariniphaga anaerophila]SHF22803.1 hypothetical protein SAMN05444274_104107 [Mariniphaga anaerophila]